MVKSGCILPQTATVPVRFVGARLVRTVLYIAITWSEIYLKQARDTFLKGSRLRTRFIIGWFNSPVVVLTTRVFWFLLIRIRLGRYLCTSVRYR